MVRFVVDSMIRGHSLNGCFLQWKTGKILSVVSKGIGNTKFSGFLAYLVPLHGLQLDASLVLYLQRLSSQLQN